LCACPERSAGSLTEEIVEKHYHDNAGNVTTPLAELFASFGKCGNRSGKREVELLSRPERARFDKLQTEPQREGFFLCRSFAKLKTEFPL